MKRLARSTREPAPGQALHDRQSTTRYVRPLSARSDAVTVDCLTPINYLASLSGLRTALRYVVCRHARPAHATR